MTATSGSIGRVQVSSATGMGAGDTEGQLVSGGGSAPVSDGHFAPVGDGQLLQHVQPVLLDSPAASGPSQVPEPLLASGPSVESCRGRRLGECFGTPAV